MKKRRFLLLFLFCALAAVSTQVTVKAQEAPGLTESIEGEKEALREGILAVLPDAAKPHLSDPLNEQAVEEAVGFRSLFSLITRGLSEEGGQNRGRILRLFAITLLFVAVSLFTKGSALSVAVEGVATLSYFGVLYETTSRIFTFFEDLSDFTLGLSPLFVSLFTGGGAVSSAALTGSGFAAFLSLISLFSTQVLPPLLRTLFALALLSALGNAPFLSELSAKLRGFTLFLFSTLSVLLLASLSFQSTLSGGADSVAIRTLKYSVSSAIPVVGGTVSGSLGALHASLSLLKSTLGGTAVVAVFALILPPLLEVFLLRLALSLCESVAAIGECGRLKETVSRFRGIFDLLLAALIITLLLFLLLLGILTHLSPFSP